MPHVLDIIEIDRSLSASIPKQIAATVGRLVEDGALRPGDRLPTLTQLAERVDASLCTIRHAYDLLAEQGIVRKTAGRGTFVATSEERSPSRVLTENVTQSPSLAGKRAGVLCGRFMLEKETKFRTMVEEFERLVSRAGGNTRIVTCGKAGPPASKWEELSLCDILLYLHPSHADDRLLERLSGVGRPLVAINYHGTLRVNRLLEDWDWAMRQIVIHLVEQGHERLAMLSLDTGNRDTGFGWVEERERAFLSECANQDLQTGGNNILRVDPDIQGRELSEALASCIPAIRDCTAVVAVNGELAVTFLDVAGDAGIAIPENISLIAFDNSFETQQHNITTVVHPNRSEAVSAFESLSLQLRVGPGTMVTQISNLPELLLRGSVRRLDR